MTRKAAGYVRVSTPKQVKKGVSRDVQKKAIKAYCKDQKLKLMEICEDAGKSGGHVEGREALIQLMRDAKGGKFDCVVCYEMDRFGRNLKESLIHADELKEFGVDLVICTSDVRYGQTEDGDLFTQIKMAIAEAERKKIFRGTFKGRIEKAKQVYPTSGKLPYGRTFNKDSNFNGSVIDRWGLDPEKVKKIEEACERFLGGEPIERVAISLAFAPRHLRNIFQDSLGGKWKIDFKSKEMPWLNETVWIKGIPRLVDESVEKAVQKKLERSRNTWAKWPRKRKYLLSGFVFCGHCGYALSGMTAMSGGKRKKGGGRIHPQPRLMYKHPRRLGKHLTECKEIKYINGEVLEYAVMTDIFGLIGGDRKSREKMLKASNAPVEEAKKIEKQIKGYEKQLKRLQSEKRHLIDLVTKTKNIDLSDIDQQMGDLKAREEILTEDIEELKDALSNLVTEKEAREASVLRKGRPTKEDMEDQMKYARLGSMERLNEMTLEEKRELLGSMFQGKDAQGRKYGVYLRKDPKGWQYEIYGDYKGMKGYILNKSKKKSSQKPASKPTTGLNTQMLGLDHVQVQSQFLPVKSHGQA